MVAFRVRWERWKDNTDINFSDNFYQMDHVEKLDCLSDAIAKLEKQYKLILTNYEKTKAKT